MNCSLEYFDEKYENLVNEIFSDIELPEKIGGSRRRMQHGGAVPEYRHYMAAILITCYMIIHIYLYLNTQYNIECREQVTSVPLWGIDKFVNAFKKMAIKPNKPPHMKLLCDSMKFTERRIDDFFKMVQDYYLAILAQAGLWIIVRLGRGNGRPEEVQANLFNMLYEIKNTSVATGMKTFEIMRSVVIPIAVMLELAERPFRFTVHKIFTFTRIPRLFTRRSNTLSEEDSTFAGVVHDGDDNDDAESVTSEFIHLDMTRIPPPQQIVDVVTAVCNNIRLLPPPAPQQHEGGSRTKPYKQYLEPNNKTENKPKNKTENKPKKPTINPKTNPKAPPIKSGFLW